MAITAGNGTPRFPASVTKPDRRLYAPKLPLSPASAARRLTIVAIKADRLPRTRLCVDDQPRASSGDTRR